MDEHGHIWQRDGFDLRVELDAGSGTPPHLLGESNVGENLDDEWFIVWLIFQISKDNPDVICQV